MRVEFAAIQYAACSPAIEKDVSVGVPARDSSKTRPDSVQTKQRPDYFSIRRNVSDENS